MVTIPALLALEDGSLFSGVSIGAPGRVVGEAVFNTAMTGYQEILTDPSYRRQIVTLTYPHIGNVGTNAEDAEAERVHVSALVVRDVPVVASSWRSQRDLPAYLRERAVVAMAGIDTRRLTRIVREKGAQNACLVAAERAGERIDADAALRDARAFAGLEGMDLAREVSTGEPYEWHEGVWRLGEGFARLPAARRGFRVVAYDFGVKRNILRILGEHGCRVSVVPATTSAAEVLALEPDGVFLSNGPGDPEPCDYAIDAIRGLLDADVPLFGICLGHQLLALAGGARTVKMKFGHHGANHPVQDLATGQVLITSQNHGFAVDEASLPANIRATHRSLFDGSLQGLRFTDRKAFGFQGHPEASPGPHDIATLFGEFVALMQSVEHGAPVTGSAGV
ncbi:MAG: glutamine-hydrolyzing carbamoyl-phosphate synthase small subunit [Gammaproteobacteria bacterium]|nr:glutamine-hydrolyzing carbamoyl-phosphate synthase small subunit [Gammaproteobacteria bacterium]